MTVAFVFYSPSLFNKTFFASPAGRLRNRNAAAFSPLKKYAAHFFNHAVGATGEKEAANPVTGVSTTTNAKVHSTRNLQMVR
jgi:hypothetical protein